MGPDEATAEDQRARSMVHGSLYPEEEHSNALQSHRRLFHGRIILVWPCFDVVESDVISIVKWLLDGFALKCCIPFR